MAGRGRGRGVLSCFGDQKKQKTLYDPDGVDYDNANVAGSGSAADHHPPPPLPHRLHLDRRHPHAPTRRQAQVAPTSLHCFVDPDPR